MRLIAITGGIGSGKSVVSTILSKLGYAVYDCDSRAKHLMATSDEIRRELVAEFGAEVVREDGSIDSQRLAKRVFGNSEALQRLNGIVHPRVKQDILRWAREHDEANAGDGSRCRPHSGAAFVETAILRESNLHTIVDEEWQVTAPEEVRVARVMKRNGLTETEVRARIASQSSYKVAHPIVNDGVTALLPQIMSRLAEEAAAANIAKKD